jgi:hypothetical protein
MRERRRYPTAATEGLDDELLRDAMRLALDDPPGRPRVARLRSSSARRSLAIAKVAYHAGLLPRALLHAEAARALAPKDPSIGRLVAAIAHRRGRISDAIALLDELALHAEPEAPALALLSHAFERSMRPMGPDRRAPALASTGARAALPDLEQSFALARARDLDAALRVVERLATRARGKDPALLKIAAIQRAWLLEQAEDLDAAIQTLEQLADEPVLTHDVERLLCLSVLYEREGTPERVRRAVRAVRYAYLATGQGSLLRRMARLLRKLGHERVAELLEARQLALFRAEHHAPSSREVTVAAETSYVPAEPLGRMFADREAELTRRMEKLLARGRSAHRRRAAILALALGHDERARDVLRSLDAEDDASGVDLLYLADAEARLGDGARAEALRRRGLARVSSLDGTTLVTVIDKLDEDTGLERILGRARLEEARATLRAHAAIDPTSPSAFRSLARVERALGSSDAAEHRARGDALAAPPKGRAARVLAAAAYRARGSMHGILHEIWVEPRPVDRGLGGAFEPSDVLGSIAPELRSHAVNLFYSVKSFAEARHPHRLVDLDATRFILKLTKEDEPSSGDSAGLPIAVAFFAALLGLSPPDDVAYSGAIVCDAHDVLVVRRVGDVEAKLEGAFERRIGRLVLPAENREDVDLSERIPRAIAAAIVRPVRSFDDVCAEIFPEL